MSSSRCVFGCTTKGITIHSFPHPDKYPDRFKIWVNMAGDTLSGLSNDAIYIKKKVCDLHFSQQHRNRFNRLNILAVPSLSLPGIKDKVNNDVLSHQTMDLPFGSSQVLSI